MTQGLSHDPRLPLWPLALFLPLLLFLPLALVRFSPLAAALAPALIYFLLVPILDAVIGRDERNLTRETQRLIRDAPVYRGLMYACIPLYAAGMAAVLWVIAYGGVPLWATTILIFGAGIMLGSVILVGHELGHNTTSKWDRRLALLALAMVGYGHFTLEHNRGHHITVATPEDPASAPKGMGLYRYTLREVWGTLKGALDQQRALLARKGLGWWRLENRLLVSWTVSLVWFGGLTLWLGFMILPALIALSLSAWFALTMANYVEHYGLRRAALPGGGYEPCQPHHSWNSSYALTNLLSFHLQRHSDHHVNAAKPYQALEHVDDAPQLPSGYPGCFALALVPPLWFSVMDPKLASLKD